MKIKYSKFEINMWDIFFLILFLGHLLGGIYILFNEKEKAGIFFLVIGISYFIYRFLLVMIIKNKMKFDFSDYEVKIKGLFFEKNNYIENNEAQKILNTSDSTVRRFLNKLVKNGILEAFGEKKGRKYRKK